MELTIHDRISCKKIDYSNPAVSVCYAKGVIRINKKLQELLRLEPKSQFKIAESKDGNLYIQRAYTNGFVLRKAGTSDSMLVANSRILCNRIQELYGKNGDFRFVVVNEADTSSGEAWHLLIKSNG